MKFSAKNIATSILAIAFLTACSGGRSKQAVTIEPAPGSKQPASDPSLQPQGEQPQGEQPQGEQPQGEQPEQEQTNPGDQEQVPDGAQPQPEVQPPSGPDTQGQGNGSGNGNGNGNGSGSGNGTTDLSIEAVLDDSVTGTGTPPSVTPGTTTVGTWDGKSFKGSGKWKVDPVN